MENVNGNGKNAVIVVVVSDAFIAGIFILFFSLLGILNYVYHDDVFFLSVGARLLLGLRLRIWFFCFLFSTFDLITYLVPCSVM